MRYPTDRETEGYSLRSCPLGGAWTASAAYSVSRYAPSMVLCVLSGDPVVFEPGLPGHPLTSTEIFAPPPDQYWIVPQSFTAAPFFGHAKRGLSAVPFSPTLINYPLLRAWCEHCDLHHSTCASATQTEHRPDKQGVGPVIRCIDCHTREVVEIQTSDRFFALSYVWGKQPALKSEYALVRIGTRETASASGKRQLPSVVPAVIENAMIMVTSLGGRYLWVDQYCIDQDDLDDKHAQIGNMAAIFEGAYATIVAFSATDSASGLPGVRNLARKPYPSVTHLKHPIPALRPSAISSAKLVTASVWMTRGWTYQEAILSRRLLIVTDYQVEFICSNAVWHECTLPEMKTGSLSRLEFLFPRPPMYLLEAITPIRRSAGRIPVSIDILNNYIMEYNRRHLTYQSDTLNAITGLLSRISLPTYLGIPFFNPIELDVSLSHTLAVEMALSRFLVGLTWYPVHEGRKHLQRRYAFPSWSWLGWEGQVGFRFQNQLIYCYDEEDPTKNPQPRARVSVQITNQVTHTKGEETLVPLEHLLNEALWGKRPTSILPHLTNYLWVEGQVIKMTFTMGRGEQSGFFVPKSYHPPMSVWYNMIRLSFRNCNPERPDLSTTMYERIMTEQWDCLLLVTKSSLFRVCYFLILDQVQQDEITEAEDCYYAVGAAMLNIRLEGDTPWYDPSLRRRIKLC
ncbi:hypothetical protein NEUTE1DRAFT_130783 [Neurospora tetrasperma FGSC 2508]|uniref:Heterokaryon incompatibility domain-containing protein n=1 Tax=Neurospora tetrasperma (strain FGSC 2508 / ATCC MYA-4615 / P0657) TaxID=510951 RepID=F8MNW9_NEUT8|nr:uncharacterized protein NEUTE1DRAFT_130783 [Neurospora tetrasperma FGSC 2508]EGO57034.1 hypothetical protein NEUTE1DRAFT_130783 [Neurospora tetrasperma FGSC 2508]EGZ70057.1 HET-domain-containing protein [Neurospora tetrasperma FGSC 2509]